MWPPCAAASPRRTRKRDDSACQEAPAQPSPHGYSADVGWNKRSGSTDPPSSLSDLRSIDCGGPKSAHFSGLYRSIEPLSASKARKTVLDFPLALSRSPKSDRLLGRTVSTVRANQRLCGWHRSTRVKQKAVFLEIAIMSSGICGGVNYPVYG